MAESDRSPDSFFSRIQSMRRLLRMISIVVGVIVTMLAPTSYFFAGYRALVQEIEAESAWTALYVSQRDGILEMADLDGADDLNFLISSLNESHTFLSYDLRGLTELSIQGRVEDLAPPTISREWPIVVGTTSVGDVQVSASLVPLLIETGFMAVVGLLLGLAAWFGMKRMPERSLRHSLEVLSDAHSESRRYADEMNYAYEKLQIQYRLNEEIADELTKARDLALASAKSKSAFLANMSHEFRTPLNAIIGFSEMIRSRTGRQLSAEDMRKYADDIFESGHHLLGIVNDILDLAKIDAGKLKLEVSQVDLHRIIKDCQRILSKSADDTGVRIVVEQPDRELRFALADQMKVKQIILNLLANAIKFTHHDGEVVLSLSNEGDSEVAFVVSDTGIGMTEEGIAAALEPFQQLDNSLSRRFDGTGLGLPLTKSLVDLHGGRMNIQSSPGVGTEVTVVLPSIDPISVLLAAGPAINTNWGASEGRSRVRKAV